MKQRMIPLMATLFLFALATPALACGDKASCPIDENPCPMPCVGEQK